MLTIGGAGESSSRDPLTFRRMGMAHRASRNARGPCPSCTDLSTVFTP